MIARIHHSSFGYAGVMRTGLCFVILYGIMCLLGSLGPETMIQKSTAFETITFDSGTAHLTAYFSNFHPESTILYGRMTLKRDLSSSKVGLEEDLDMKIDLTGTKPFDFISAKKNEIVAVDDQKLTKELRFEKGEAKSKSFFIFGVRPLECEDYTLTLTLYEPVEVIGPLKAEIEVHSMNPIFIHFELGFKYLFLAYTLIALFAPCGVGFLSSLRSVPVKQWTKEQIWVLALLECLLLFNDPFYAAQVYTSNTESLSVLYVVFQSTFLTTLLAFWLCSMDDMLRYSRTRQIDRDAMLDGPRETESTCAWVLRWHKYVLMGIIWILFMSVFITMRIRGQGDPTYNGLGDTSLRPSEQALIVFLSIYVLELAILLISNGLNFMELSWPFRFLYGLTTFTIVLTLTGIFSGFFFPVARSSVIFISFYGLPNLYVWALYFAYSNVTAADDSDRQLLYDGDDEVSLNFQGRSDFFKDVPHQERQQQRDEAEADPFEVDPFGESDDIGHIKAPVDIENAL